MDFKVVLEFLLQPQILGAISVVLLAIIGFWGKAYLNHLRVVFQVWHLVEKLGVLTGVAGYAKLALAMGIFQEKFYEKFGREPDASDEGWAVKILTLLCKLENKEDIDDFLEEPTDGLKQERLNEDAA